LHISSKLVLPPFLLYLNSTQGAPWDRDIYAGCQLQSDEAMKESQKRVSWDESSQIGPRGTKYTGKMYVTTIRLNNQIMKSTSDANVFV